MLCYEDAPIPEPGPREVLVRVHAAGVNPADRQIRASLPFRLEKPAEYVAVIAVDYGEEGVDLPQAGG